jgi:2-keto-4-pentenoate hydratase
MRVAECEVVFHFAQSLIPRPSSYSRSEVLAALAAVGPGIEVPDSRFLHFECAGAAQLTADCACTNDMVLGTPVALDVRLEQLAELSVRAEVSDGRIATGSGRNVMGDPVEALVWLVNELGRAGQTLGAGQFVTTGACVAPIPVVPGDRVAADFGWLGTIQAGF